MNMELINSIIGYSFSGFVVLLLILANIFWGEVKRFNKTNNDPNVRLLWGLSALDGFLFFIFIVSVMIKIINIVFK